MKLNLKFPLGLILILNCLDSFCQLSGVYSVPGTHTSIASFITNLNSSGITGSVTLNIAAGYTETAPFGGYTLTATGTSVNPITFQKNGTGSNPLITAYVGGTGLSNSAIQDGIWRIVGGDFITIDGVDLLDPNTSNPSTMEFGYAFFKASSTDGCQNNTIKNCSINLNRTNIKAGSGPASDGSRGIDVINAYSNSHTIAVSVTSPSGANSNNRFYNNSIQNCNIGIAVVGFSATSPYLNADSNNDIGGNITSTGNSIQNFGGGPTATVAAVGVRTQYQWNLNVSYNTIINNNGSGINHINIIRGIHLNAANGANSSITNNTITVSSSSYTSSLIGIENAAGSTAFNNTITINKNLITNCTYTSSTSGSFYGINNTSTPQFLSISSNTFLNNSSNAVSGFYYSISNSGMAAAFIRLDSNAISNISLTASTNSVPARGIYTSGTSTTNTISISGNSMQSVYCPGSMFGSECDFIYNSATSNSISIANNLIGPMTISTDGTCYFIYNTNNTPNSTISNNKILNLNRTGTNVGMITYGYYNIGTPTSGTTTIVNNNFSNVTQPGWYHGIMQASTNSQTSFVNTNTVTNISGAGSVTGINNNRGTINSTMSGNLLCAWSISGSAEPVRCLGGALGMTISSNIIRDINSLVGAAIWGIETDVINTKIFKNKITDLNAYSTSTSIYGIYFPGSTTGTGTTSIYNNLIGNLNAPNTQDVNGVVGIWYLGSNSAYFNASFNSIFLNATTTSTLFGSAGIVHWNSTSSGGNLILKNNIIINNSVSSGIGKTASIFRLDPTLINYSPNSNNNIFYAGASGPSNVLYTDGTNNYQTLTSFKTAVSPRESSSYTENSPFVTTTGSSANFLNLNTVIPTLAESKAIPIAGISDDYAGNMRNVSTPDIGAWEGNFMIPTFIGDPLHDKNFVINIYPNPNNGHFIISSNYIEGAELTICDTQGRNIHTQELFCGENTVIIRSLSEGIYYYQIISKDHISDNGKIIIKR